MVRRSEKRNDSMWLETSCHGPHVHARFDELRRGEMTEVVQPRAVEFEPVTDPAEESGDVVRAELRGAVNDGREHERIVGQFFALAVKPRPPIRSRQCTAHRLCVSATGSFCVVHRLRYVICVTTQIDGLPSDARFETAAATLKMLADPTRLRILWALLHGEHSVNELAAHVGSPASTVSQHLAKLRLARLVRTRRHGTQVFYVAENDHLERLTTEALFHADHATGTDRGAVSRPG